MRRIIVSYCLLLTLTSAILWAQTPTGIQFIITSDSHYGFTRAEFRGAKNVDGHTVNAALVAQMNGLPNVSFPTDGGLRAGQTVGPIDFVADNGDIANREEVKGNIQSAAKSWAQFRMDYIEGLRLVDRTGRKTPLYVVPGNHDVSNAIGYDTPMQPLMDKTSMVEIYNLMMAPATPKTAATYEYPRDRILVSHDIGGIHFVFLTIWPDSANRKWLETDLQHVSAGTPVILFMHDPPGSDTKHFTNPNGKHDINNHDKFENLLVDGFADAPKGGVASDAAPLIEQREFEKFLHQHPNVTAYFHGHNNWNQFYDWTGPDHTVTLHTFRQDSPMKGHFSATDETKLSFQIATVDMASRTMTVREVLWNANPQHPDGPIVWGASTTVALSPRPPSN